MSPTVEQAKVFAIAAHSAIGQRRKYTYEPYWTHPGDVAATVASVGGTDSMIAAAWLHDVVEDTAVTIEDVRMMFGAVVADYVSWLTDVSRPEDGNRAARKAIDLAHIAQCPAEVATIKLADIISNSSSIVKHDPEFAKVYLVEKAAQMQVLKHGDATLWHHAAGIIG